MAMTSINVENIMELVKILLISYTTSKIHIIINLIIIEFVSMLLVAGMAVMISDLTMEPFMILFSLILMIAESVVGLSIVISMIRTHSNDYIKASTITKF